MAEEVVTMAEKVDSMPEEVVSMAEEVVTMVEKVDSMPEEVDSMAEEIVDTMVTVEKYVLEDNPAPNSGSPVSEHVADIDHRRASVGSKSSRGKPDSVKNVVPSYLRASTGSCHDFCKYGKKHTFEEKPWKQKPERKPIASSSVDCVLIKVAGERKKEMVGSTSLDAKISSSASNTSSGDKTRPLKYNPPSTKRAPSVEPPEVIKKVISSPSQKIDVQEKRASLAGGKISKTGEKVDQDSDKCPPRRRASLAGDKLSKTLEEAKSSKSPPPRRAALADDKLSKTEEMADSQSDKSPPPRRASMAGDKLSKTEEKEDSHSDKYPPPRRASLAGDKLSRTKKKADLNSGKYPPLRRASLAGDKLSRTEKKSDLQSNKCPLPRGASFRVGKISKTAQKEDQHSIKPTLRKKALTGGDKIPEIKDEADQQSDRPSPSKPKPTQAKPPPPSDNLDGTCRKGEGKSNIKTERKMSISRSVKKALAPIAAASTPKLRLVRTVSLKRKDGESNIKTERKISISRSVKKALAPIAASTPKLHLVRNVPLERKKSGSLKVASLTKDRTKTTRTPKSEEVPEKTLHVIKLETGSSAKASPQEKDARVKDKFKRTPRSKAVSSEDKHRTPVKLLFRSGKVIELLPPDSNNTPRRLKFRRARAPVGESSNGGSTKRSLNNKAGGKADGAGDEVPTKRVILKRQVVQGKKEVRVLLNNVIEETASKLVESRKSKVKALVGAFETVISLQEEKKNPPSQSPKLSTG